MSTLYLSLKEAVTLSTHRNTTHLHTVTAVMIVVFVIINTAYRICLFVYFCLGSGHLFLTKIPRVSLTRLGILQILASSTQFYYADFGSDWRFFCHFFCSIPQHQGALWVMIYIMGTMAPTFVFPEARTSSPKQLFSNRNFSPYLQ